VRRESELRRDASRQEREHLDVDDVRQESELRRGAERRETGRLDLVDVWKESELRRGAARRASGRTDPADARRESEWRRDAARQETERLNPADVRRESELRRGAEGQETGRLDSAGGRPESETTTLATLDKKTRSETFSRDALELQRSQMQKDQDQMAASLEDCQRKFSQLENYWARWTSLATEAHCIGMIFTRPLSEAIVGLWQAIPGTEHEKSRDAPRLVVAHPYISDPSVEVYFSQTDDRPALVMKSSDGYQILAQDLSFFVYVPSDAEEQKPDLEFNCEESHARPEDQFLKWEAAFRLCGLLDADWTPRRKRVVHDRTQLLPSGSCGREGESSDASDSSGADVVSDSSSG